MVPSVSHGVHGRSSILVLGGCLQRQVHSLAGRRLRQVLAARSRCRSLPAHALSLSYPPLPPSRRSPSTLQIYKTPKRIHEFRWRWPRVLSEVEPPLLLRLSYLAHPWIHIDLLSYLGSCVR
jgi:hypothetical protein